MKEKIMFIASKDDRYCCTCGKWKGIRNENPRFFFTMEYATGKCPTRETGSTTLPSESCPDWMGVSQPSTAFAERQASRITML